MAEPLTVREIVADVIHQGRDTIRVGRETIYYIFNGRWDGSAICQQLEQLGTRSLDFVLVTQGFLGAIMSVTAAGNVGVRRAFGLPGPAHAAAAPKIQTAVIIGKVAPGAVAAIAIGPTPRAGVVPTDRPTHRAVLGALAGTAAIGTGEGRPRLAVLTAGAG